MRVYQVLLLPGFHFRSEGVFKVPLLSIFSHYALSPAVCICVCIIASNLNLLYVPMYFWPLFYSRDVHIYMNHGFFVLHNYN